MNDDESFAIRQLALRVANLAAEVEQLRLLVPCEPCREGRHTDCTGDCPRNCCAVAADDGSQRWVDEVCHYRNLAIELGAKRTDMLSEHDADLHDCWLELTETARRDGERSTADERAETADIWAENDALTAENERLRTVGLAAEQGTGAE